jgi:hypothetical protein
VVPLGSVTNASRTVSYVVIKVLRYDDVAMVDLRVQDMELVVDLRGTPPWVPTPPPDEEPPAIADDGTHSRPMSDTSTGVKIEESSRYHESRWIVTNFWPELLCQLFDDFFDTLLRFAVNLLGSVRVLLNDVSDWVNSLAQSLSEVDLFFSVCANFRPSLLVWQSAYFAGYTCDTLRVSGAGLGAAAGAAVAAAALSLLFFASIELWVQGAISIGVSYGEMLEMYLVFFIVLVVTAFSPVTSFLWSVGCMRAGFDAAMKAAYLLRPAMDSSIGTWHPVLGLARIVFILLTVGYFLWRIDFYRDLRNATA